MIKVTSKASGGKSTSSGKDKKFGVIVLGGTGKFFQKLLFNRRDSGDNLRDVVYLAGMAKIRAICRRMMVPDRPGNVLLNVLLKRLGYVFYLPAVAVAHNLMNGIVVVMGR